MERTVGPSEFATTAVKRVISDLEECQPSQLGTISHAVDIDELDAVTDSVSATTEDGTQSVSFRYCGYSIEVFSSRAISIEP